MKALPRALAFASVVIAATAYAGEPSAPAEAPAWSFSITAYPTDVRGGDNYTSGIAIADHGSLHLEGRYNYESVGARSLFVGWAFSGGETVQWQITPIVGGAWGNTQSAIGGFEASVAWRAIDFYVEAEYVPTTSRDDSYTYAWSELGFRPLPWLRVGIVGQRTRTYGGDREFQRGPLAQVTFGPVTIGGFWFNPGSSEQVFVASIGAKF